MSEWSSYKQWIEQLSEKELTKQAYKHLFAEFVEWVQLAPNQLITLASTDRPRLEKKIQEYIQHLTNEGRHICSIESAYYAIQSFFQYNHHNIAITSLPSSKSDPEIESHQ